MTVVVREPPAALAGFVQSMTYEAGHQTEASRERILPGATMSLWVNLNVDEFRFYSPDDHGTMRRLPGAILEGPRDRATVVEIEGGRSQLSVTFTLGLAPPIFRLPPQVARNEWVSLEDLWGRDGAAARERLLEAGTPDEKLRILELLLLAQLPHAPQPDPAVLIGVAALERGVPVTVVANELGLLPSTFRRRFLDQVGVTPKRFARVRRLQQVVRAIEGVPAVDWSGVAAEHGYCDQAHLVDDFKDLVGLTPTAYLRHRTAPNHVRLSRPEVDRSARRREDWIGRTLRE